MTSERFREIRDKYNATQREWADLLQVGKGTIHRLEKKEGNIKRVYAMAAKYLEDNPGLYELWKDEKDAAIDEMRASILRGA